MNGGSHIEMARELVIPMGKGLCMECQLLKRVQGRGATFVSQDKKSSQNERF